MPVGFENCQPSDLPGPNTNGRTILHSLAATLEAGCRADEVIEALDIPRGSAGTALSKLHDQGSVCHKGEYWAINPDAYNAHTASLIGSVAVNEQLGGDCYDENPGWDANPPDLDESEDADSGTG